MKSSIIKRTILTPAALAALLAATAVPVYSGPEAVTPAEPVVEAETVAGSKPMPEPPQPIIGPRPLQVNVYFNNASSRLTHETLVILTQASSQLANERVNSVKVSGFASAVGNSDYNQVLSERRANAIAQYIRDNWRLTGDKVSVVAHGEDRLVNGSQTNNSRDRRVLVKISFN